MSMKSSVELLPNGLPNVIMPSQLLLRKWEEAKQSIKGAVEICARNDHHLNKMTASANTYNRLITK
ncbi:hypothetical protein Ahy_A04g017624 isoform D [Arachis hypogaea]|uniref:Uncharacterized protein n=1 Tax=Arachis hypogaea TaxID=3818 RepID=A0A445DBM4_ARAHY|nr:hypothetical protein Ahy_A04g017624 isoform D [Arachis hypogaea]